MTRFITLHRTPIFTSGDDSTPTPLLVNVAHIVQAGPAKAATSNYRCWLSLLGEDGSDVQLADEFETVQRLMLTDASASSPPDAIAQAMDLLRAALSGLAAQSQDTLHTVTFIKSRERIEHALALLGAENTIETTAAGEPPIMTAADVAKLRVGGDCRVYDRLFNVTLDAYVVRRGDAPAGVELRFQSPSANFHLPITEHFDNTGRSVATVPAANFDDVEYQAERSRFYVVAPAVTSPDSTGDDGKHTEHTPAW